MLTCPVLDKTDVSNTKKRPSLTVLAWASTGQMIGNGSMVGMCNSIYVAHNFFVRDKKGILFFISGDTDIGKIQIHGAKLFFIS